MSEGSNNQTPGSVSPESAEDPTVSPDEALRASDELIPDFLRPKKVAPSLDEPEDLPVRMVIPADSNEAYVVEPSTSRADDHPQNHRASSENREGARAAKQDDASRARKRSGSSRRKATPKRDGQTPRAAKGPHPETEGRETLDAGANTNPHPRPSASEQSQKRNPALFAGALIVIVAIVLTVSLALGNGSIGSDSSDSATSVTSTNQTVSSDDDGASLTSDQIKAALKDIGLSSSEARKGAKEAQSDSRITQIVANADAYKKEGKDVQQRLIELAIDDSEAVDFVVNWPDRYPEEKGEDYTDDVKKGTVPQLYQWDERWGYTTYSGTTFARTGCGPTALSMVYMGLTGKTDKTPYDMGQLAREDGYESPHNGTVGDFLTDDAEKLGLTCQTLTIDETALRAWLDQDGVVICNVGAGDFTDGGHFFVITGIDKKGKLTIHDPYSSVRSAKHWSITRILNQTIALYGFTAAA